MESKIRSNPFDRALLLAFSLYSASLCLLTDIHTAAYAAADIINYVYSTICGFSSTTHGSPY